MNAEEPLIVNVDSDSSNASDDSVICLEPNKIGDKSSDRTRFENVYAIISFNPPMPPPATPPRPSSPDCVLLDERFKQCSKPAQESSLLTPLFAIDESHANKTAKEIRQGSEYPCSYCDKIFYDIEPLRRHELQHVKTKNVERFKKRRQSKCQFCSKVILTQSKLRWHEADCETKAQHTINRQVRNSIKRKTCE